MPSTQRHLSTSLLALGAVLVLGACAHRAPDELGRSGSEASSMFAAGAAAAPATMGDMQQLYRAMGLIAGGASMPFVVSASFLHAPSPDSTLVLFSLALPSRALGFARESDHYMATYSVHLRLRQGNSVVHTIDATEMVRVPTFRETTRTDESIIWQRYLPLAPGRYGLSVGVEDESGGLSGTQEVNLAVPPLAMSQLASPVMVFEAIPRRSVDSLPRILAHPRSSVIFGQDSIVPLYIDAVGQGAPDSIEVRVIGESNVLTWSRMFSLPMIGGTRSRTIAVPVRYMNIGVSSIQVVNPGTVDTAATKVLVGFGGDLPIANFDEMLSYLRYFASPDRLKRLRDTPPTERGDAWAEFLRETDPIPGTEENEAIVDYFGRIRTANVRFRDDDRFGWQSDRGMTFVALGEPDNIIDTGVSNPNLRPRQQIWEYRGLRIEVVFIDDSGFGRWRLPPQGRAQLEDAFKRRLAEMDR